MKREQRVCHWVWLEQSHLDSHWEFLAYSSSSDPIEFQPSFKNLNKQWWWKKQKLAFHLSLYSIRSVLERFKNSKWVWSGNTTITNCRLPCGTARKSRSTITRHQEDKPSKATSSLFPIKMIAILEWTQSNTQQNIEQLQTHTMGVTLNKKSTTTEPPP